MPIAEEVTTKPIKKEQGQIARTTVMIVETAREMVRVMALVAVLVAAHAVALGADQDETVIAEVIEVVAAESSERSDVAAVMIPEVARIAGVVIVLRDLVEAEDDEEVHEDGWCEEDQEHLQVRASASWKSLETDIQWMTRPMTCSSMPVPFNRANFWMHLNRAAKATRTTLALSLHF